MKLIKALSGFSIAATLLFMLSCDDRLPSESEAAVETGSLELAYVFIHGLTDNPTIVGEVLSETEKQTAVVVIARLLDGEGNGCLLYTSPSTPDAMLSSMPSSA